MQVSCMLKLRTAGVPLPTSHPETLNSQDKSLLELSADPLHPENRDLNQILHLQTPQLSTRH